MYATLAEIILRYRRTVLAAFLVLAVACLATLPQLGFDFTPQQLLRTTSDSAEYRELFAQRFGREDNLVFLSVKSERLFEPQTLTFLRDLTFDLREMPEVQAADSIATVQIPRSSSPGVLSTEPIVPAAGAISAEQAEALRDLAMNEPLVKGQLVGRSGAFTAILVWIEPDIQDVERLQATLDAFNAAIAARGPPQGVEIQMGGVPFLRTDIVRELKRQQMTFIPGTGLVYLLVLLLLFRRPAGVVGPMAVVIIATLMTVALLVGSGSSINIINNVLPSLIFIIGVSDSIHMLTRDAEETEAGCDRERSVAGMIRHTGAACLLTSTTTAVGFFSLLSADTEILIDFGWQAGAGVVFAYFVTLFFLPALVVHMKPVERKAVSSAGEAKQPVLERSLVALGDKVLRHPWAFVALGLGVAAVSAYFGSTVKRDTVLLEVYEPGHPTWESTLDLERELSGVLPVEISLEADDVDAFKDPSIVAKMHEMAKFAIQDEIVLGTQSFVDYHQAARAALLDDPAQREVMPESREQVEQLHILVAGSPDSKTGVNRMVTPDFRYARILLRARDAGAREQLRLGGDLEAKLAEVFDGTPIRYKITGDAYVASAALDSFIVDLFNSLMLAMLIIFAMMTAVFRSLKIGLISILPNVIPLMMTFGYMGIAGIDLNTTTIIIFAISLGIAVDDTIHFLARFREEFARSPDDVRTAILNTYNGAGRAILITSTMLILGLVVLLSSNFVPTRQFGKLTAITIAGAILGDLLLLPAILYLVYRRRERGPSGEGTAPTPATHSSED